MSKLLILKHHLLTSTDNLESDCKYHIGMNFWIALSSKFNNNNFISYNINLIFQINNKTKMNLFKIAPTLITMINFAGITNGVLV